MRFGAYLKDTFSKIMLFVALATAVLAVLFAARASSFVILCVAVLFVVFGFPLILYDFLSKRSFYNEMFSILAQLDQKFLLSEMLHKPNFLEGKLFVEVLYETNKSMNEQVAKCKNQMTDFRDFLELWIHEVKAPLSSLNLALRGENHAPKIYIKAIENYIEQALFYSKIDTVDKDYIIKKVNLGNIVNEVIKNNKDVLIDTKIKVVLENLNLEVFSDSKWLRFIINQIILNSIKYHDKNPEIQISATREKNITILRIRDNGIGIKASEAKRVFEKGFTGSNDRKQKISTGMGLYISQKLAIDLGHRISLTSAVGEHTELNIIFGANDHLLLH